VQFCRGKISDKEFFKISGNRFVKNGHRRNHYVILLVDIGGDSFSDFFPGKKDYKIIQKPLLGERRFNIPQNAPY
jgi:hypothetical protein